MWSVTFNSPPLPEIVVVLTAQEVTLGGVGS